MKAVQHDRIGDPAEVLEVVDLPDPVPGEGQVRVKVLAAPIHPATLLQIAGQYGVKPDLPEVPGAEAVGEVVELGPGVAAPAVGTKVLLAGGSGLWAEAVVAPAGSVIPVPDSDVEQLSMATINPLTAWLLLTDMADVPDGGWIVQSGANSAVGEYLIQIARELGLKTINVVRREELRERLTALGADAVIEDGPDLGRRIREAAGGAPVTLGIDCVGGETLSGLMGGLAPGGTLVSYGAISGQAARLDPGAVIFGELTIKGFWLAKWFRTASEADRTAAFGKVLPLILSGKVRASVDARYPLDGVREAVSRAAEPGRDGKVLLVPGLAQG